MSNLTKVVERLDGALKALTGLGVRGTARRHGPAQASGKRRTMSAAARRRIRCGAARSLGQMESGPARQMTGNRCNGS